MIGETTMNKQLDDVAEMAQKSMEKLNKAVDYYVDEEYQESFLEEMEEIGKEEPVPLEPKELFDKMNEELVMEIAEMLHEEYKRIVKTPRLYLEILMEFSDEDDISWSMIKKIDEYVKHQLYLNRDFDDLKLIHQAFLKGRAKKLIKKVEERRE